jgi:NarL family two-component system sensor histidine kinase YdfH
MKTPESTSNLQETLWQEITSSLKGIRPVWPFFALLTLAMAVIYGFTVTNDSVIRSSVPLLIGFSLLMLVHLALHWLSPLAGKNALRAFSYLGVQLVLVFWMIAMTRYETLVYGLFMGLIGEMLGIVRPLRRSLIGVTLLIAAMFTISGVYFGWANVFPLMITILPLTFFVVIYVYLFTKQMEEKKRAEDLLEDLEIAHQQLSEYAVKIENLTLTNERQRMARELHDTLAQGLAGVILQLEAAADHLQKGNEERAQAILQQSIGRARSTLAEARQVIDDLRMLPQSRTDLAELLREEAERLRSVDGPECEVTCPEPIFLNEENALQIEKIVSEALTNIAKHASARRCRAKAQADADHLHIEIEDDGIGFDPEAPAGPGHYGLVGMRERVRLLNGALRIESVSGQGTRCLIDLPAAVIEREAA